MISVKNILLFLTTLLVAVSCSKTPFELLSEQERSLRSKGDYNAYLSLEYLQFSRSLLQVDDKKTSKYFAKKGLKVASNQRVVPENPLDWDADKEQVEEMIIMQKRLETVLYEPNIKFYLPIQLAHLTYLYDCWISRESKAIFRADELARCRVRYVKLLNEVELYIEDLKKDKTPKVKITEPKFERFEIFFDFNNYKLNNKANKKLISVLKYLKTLNGDYRILLVGNADRSGKELYNQNLALNRAARVKNYLRKNGVVENLIEMRSVGEDFPDILTRDGSQKQMNRSVGIYILKGGFKSFKSFPLPLIDNYVYRDEIRRARDRRGLKN